ncbi:MAG: chloride channel protein [Candidatus Latescibacterota bacterium]|nr:MAG: chloride channel protein [Candidatus Latescibacterota bacterium]
MATSASRGKRFEERLRRAVVALGSAELQHGARWLLYCAAVGIVAGLGGLLFDYLSRAGVHFFLERLAGWSPALPAGEEPLFHFVPDTRRLWALALVPALGGLLSGALVRWLAAEAAGHGTDAAIQAYHTRAGYIRPTVPLVKILASALTLGSGGSGGREGPIAQTGAGFGSFIATRLRLSAEDRRILMAAGIGAGIGSIFRAPLAGALFASEILYSSSEFEATVMIPACIASIIAYCTFTLFHGTGTLFRTGALTFTNPLELAAYFALALVLVVYGFLYVRTFYGVHRWFERWKVPVVLKPALGGLFTGLLGVGLLAASGREESLSVLGFGYGVIQDALDAPTTLTVGAGLLAIIALGKIVTTSFSIGSGGSAGVFGPSMVIGGCVGGAVGLILHNLFPNVVQQPAAYVVVGMAGFFSGIAKTPISTLVMVSEMTGSYSLLLPSMWVCALTFAMSRRWKLYSSQVPNRVDSPAHQGRYAIDVLRGIRVAEVVRADAKVHVLHEGEGLGNILTAIASTEQTTFPVLDSGGVLVGVVSLEQIRRVINEHLPADVIIAQDLMVSDFPHVTPNTDLAAVLRLLASVDLDEIIVWDEAERHFLGLLSRKQVTRTYVERMAEMELTR